MKLRQLTQTFLPTLLALLASGCVIQKADVVPPVQVGSVYVTLHNAEGASIDSAQISLDGIPRQSYTPDTLGSIPVGRHVVGAFKAGFEPASDTVDIAAGVTVDAALITSPAVLPPPVIQLEGAPDSTALLLNTNEYGLTPSSTFDSLSVGSYEISVYKPEHATALPARWMANLQLGDTARIAVQLSPLATGNQAGSLAPVFNLVNDRLPDTSRYRLQDYRGRVILITFFFADCAPCLAEMPYLQRVYSDSTFEDQIEFFGIDPNDNYFTFAFYRSTYGGDSFVSFPLLWGLGQGVKEAYGVVQFPTNFVIDKTGTIRLRLDRGLTEEELRDAVTNLLAE